MVVVGARVVVVTVVVEELFGVEGSPMVVVVGVVVGAANIIDYRLSTRYMKQEMKSSMAKWTHQETKLCVVNSLVVVDDI